MRYIEQNQNVTMEYEVIIDEEKLRKIIQELNEKCSHVIRQSTRVTSGSREEALEKISSDDRSDINVTSVYDADTLGDGYEFLMGFTRPHFVFECEYSYRQPPYLAYLLTGILNSYPSNKDMTDTINLLINYENDKELKSYRDRMEREGITKEVYDEYELLYGLYQAARDSIKGKLVSEVIHYYNDENDKGKRLGR